MLASTLWRSEYPFTSHWHRLGAVRYHYLDEGAGERPIVAVHGNPTWSFYWRHLIRALRSGHRVLAVDHVGCGLSDKPQRYPYRLAQHRDNLIDLIDSLDLRRITFVAHDWGGAIAASAAVRRSDRVERLVFLNTGTFPPPYVPWRIAVCRTPLAGTLAVRGANAFARAATTMAIARRPLSPAAKAGLLAPYSDWASRIAIDRFVRDIPTSPRHPTWGELERLEAELPGLADRPALLVWGMRDWCFRPSCLERLRGLLPEAEVRTLADAGHYVMEDATDEVVAHIAEFLART